MLAPHWLPAPANQTRRLTRARAGRARMRVRAPAAAAALFGVFCLTHRHVCGRATVDDELFDKKGPASNATALHASGE